MNPVILKLKIDQKGPEMQNNVGGIYKFQPLINNIEETVKLKVFLLVSKIVNTIYFSTFRLSF